MKEEVKEIVIREPDRISISYDVKISRNYNSAGNPVGYSSSAKDGEIPEELFKRVRSVASDMLKQSIKDCKLILSQI